MGAALIEAAWFSLYCYLRKRTVTSFEQGVVPASHTLYVKRARPVVPVESVYLPVFGTVAITIPSR